jgi:transposase-like protein
MPRQSRRSFTTEQKVAILRRRLMDKVPVSDLALLTFSWM